MSVLDGQRCGCDGPLSESGCVDPSVLAPAPPAARPPFLCVGVGKHLLTLPIGGVVLVAAVIALHCTALHCTALHCTSATRQQPELHEVARGQVRAQHGPQHGSGQVEGALGVRPILIF